MTESLTEKARKMYRTKYNNRPSAKLDRIEMDTFTSTDTDQRQKSVPDVSQEIKQASFTDDFLQGGCREFLFKFERSKKRK